VGAKKAKAKSKETKEKSAEKSEGRNKKPADILQVRENITNMVTDSAEDIATGVIAGAKSGQLASARYLFEVAGLYPATDETAAALPEHSLAHTLLKRMGLPTEPVIGDEDQVPAALTGNARQAVRKPARTSSEELEDEDAQGTGCSESDGEEQKNGKDTVE
jgi:hypothetical protein